MDIKYRYTYRLADSNKYLTLTLTQNIVKKKQITICDALVVYGDVMCILHVFLIYFVIGELNI